MKTLYPYKIALLTEPEIEPVSQADFLANSRIDDVDLETGVIDSCLLSARMLCENELGRVLITQTWEAYYFEASSQVLYLPKPDIIKRDTVPTGEEWAIDVYSIEDEVETLVPRTDWLYKDSIIPTIYLNDDNATVWPDNDAIRIEYDCGMSDDAAGVPAPIKRWILIKAAELYENREASGMKPMVKHPFVCGLLDPYRVRRF